MTATKSDGNESETTVDRFFVKDSVESLNPRVPDDAEYSARSKGTGTVDTNATMTASSDAPGSKPTATPTPVPLNSTIDSNSERLAGIVQPAPATRDKAVNSGLDNVAVGDQGANPAPRSETKSPTIADGDKPRGMENPESQLPAIQKAPTKTSIKSPGRAKLSQPKPTSSPPKPPTKPNLHQQGQFELPPAPVVGCSKTMVPNQNPLSFQVLTIGPRMVGGAQDQVFAQLTPACSCCRESGRMMSSSEEKTACLSLSCPCFAHGSYCSERCACSSSCSNHCDAQEVRTKAISDVLFKNSNAFRLEAEKTSELQSLVRKWVRGAPPSFLLKDVDSATTDPVSFVRLSLLTTQASLDKPQMVFRADKFRFHSCPPATTLYLSEEVQSTIGHLLFHCQRGTKSLGRSENELTKSHRFVKWREPETSALYCRRLASK